jgi:hypothetical protein
MADAFKEAAIEAYTMGREDAKQKNKHEIH